MVLRGPESVTSWSPSRAGCRDDTPDRVAGRRTTRCSVRGCATAARDRGDAAGARGGPRDRTLGALVTATARFLSAADGPRDRGARGERLGHARQSARSGQLAARLAGLDGAVAALKRDLGAVWSSTALLVVTEFGRTVAANGTRGTDHGTGGCAFLAGGAVQGGRVIADWPGLADRDLYQSRDLKPTTDLRAVFKGVLRDHLKVTGAGLDTEVFPESRAVAALDGLVA